jgi:hypothetical protein
MIRSLFGFVVPMRWPMRSILPVFLVGLVGLGCNEYDLASTLPPGDLDNVRPLEEQIRTEKLVQTPTPAVDVLWVIDNSGSMADEQSALTTNFPSFMQYFLGSGLDYHIGVISTDMDVNGESGKLQDAGDALWIDVDTQFPEDVFADTASMGVNGSGDEQGIGAAWTALEVKADTYNAGFQRTEAALHVIVISDENDHTNGDPVTVNEFGGYLANLKLGSDMVTFNSIVNKPGCCDGLLSLDEQAGEDYIAVTDFVGGIMWDIRNENWVQLLTQLGAQAAGLKREFYLAALPVPGSIVVWVEEDGVAFSFDEGTDWTYDAQRNSITFLSYIPNPLAEVYIEYADLGSSEN